VVSIVFDNIIVDRTSIRATLGTRFNIDVRHAFISLGRSSSSIYTWPAFVQRQSAERARGIGFKPLGFEAGVIRGQLRRHDAV
jgi:hypothetical protein